MITKEDGALDATDLTYRAKQLAKKLGHEDFYDFCIYKNGRGKIILRGRLFNGGFVEEIL